MSETESTAPQVIVAETALEIDWEEHERQFSQQVDQLAKKENLTEKVEKAKVDTALKVKDALALFEKVTGLSQPRSHPSFADLDLELAQMGEPTPIEKPYLQGIPGKIVESLIQSLLFLIASSQSENLAAAPENSRIVALDDEYRQKLEKTRTRAKVARSKMGERLHKHGDARDWPRRANTLEDYYQVIDEVYE